jgi:hypothetical protein
MPSPQQSWNDYCGISRMHLHFPVLWKVCARPDPSACTDGSSSPATPLRSPASIRSSAAGIFSSPAVRALNSSSPIPYGSPSVYVFQFNLTTSLCAIVSYLVVYMTFDACISINNPKVIFHFSIDLSFIHASVFSQGTPRRARSDVVQPHIREIELQSHAATMSDPIVRAIAFSQCCMHACMDVLSAVSDSDLWIDVSAV